MTTTDPAPSPSGDSGASGDTAAPNDAVLSILESKEILFGILAFVDEQQRNQFLFVSRTFADLLTTEESFLWRLHRLHAEFGIYFSDLYQPSTVSYRQLFVERSKHRFVWIPSPSEHKPTDPKETFQVRVSARVKPASAELYKRPANRTDGQRTKRVTLPLHQRLALIRLSRNLKSNEEAMKVLQEQGGIGWNRSSLNDIPCRSANNVPQTMFFVSMNGAGYNTNNNTDDTTCDDNRRRNDDASPTNDKENELDGRRPNSTADLPSLTCGITHVDDRNGRIVVADTTKGLREMSFDTVLRDSCSQAAAYSNVAHGAVSDFLCGYNSICIVYGQTGSGKTYTMFGHEDDTFSVQPSLTGPHKATVANYTWGIVPRACKEIFDAIEFRKSQNNLNHPIQSKMNMSYVEVYGNEVTDLLHNGRACGQSRVAAHRYVLDGSTQQPVHSFQQAIKMLQEGQRQKRVAATAMNARSSRAHSIVVLNLTQDCPSKGTTVTSTLFFADLGGSEQLKKSQANSDVKKMDVETRRQRTDEAVQINLGLLALKQCIEFMAKASRSSSPSKAFVPYKDSKLTMLLSPGLGGNSKTNVIVCASQEEVHASETIAALQFGQSCARISKSALRRPQESVLYDVIADIDKNIKECNELIKEHERWETKQMRRPDGYGGYETYTVSRLVGAEVHHERLEALHRRRSALTGTKFD